MFFLRFFWIFVVAPTTLTNLVICYQITLSTGSVGVEWVHVELLNEIRFIGGVYTVFEA